MNDELELHNISTLDKARLKAKVVEEKSKRSSPKRFKNIYARRKASLTT